MTISLRLLTIFCYFLPFTFFLATCNGLGIDVAFNRKDAVKNILVATKGLKPITDSGLVSDIPDTISKDTKSLNSNIPIDSLYEHHSFKPRSSKSLTDNIIFFILFPADKSVSGIGSIWFYKNLIGQIAIGFSLFLSLLLLVTLKIWKIKKNHQHLILLNLLCVVIFIADSLLSAVSLLIGTWALLTILIIQLLIDHTRQRSLQLTPGLNYAG